jgi:hypothetical protein
VHVHTNRSARCMKSAGVAGVVPGIFKVVRFAPPSWSASLMYVMPLQIASQARKLGVHADGLVSKSLTGMALKWLDVLASAVLPHCRGSPTSN